MGTSPRLDRRALLVSSLMLAVSGCRQLAPISTKSTNPPDPQDTVRQYFSFLSEDRYDDAKNLMTSGFQSRLGAAAVQNVLHSIRTAQVTSIIDAVAWANGLGARLPSPPGDKREYLVTLAIQPTPVAGKTWSSGTNRRFIDLAQQASAWRIDAIGVSPGELVTGKPPIASADASGGSSKGVVIPIEPLRLGSVPIDRAIYAVRQNAADRGIIPWARDPIQVVHRDGPSFGINPGDAASLIGRDTDPVNLLPRANVLVHHGDLMLVVILEQLIRPGETGIWAITEVRQTPV